MSDDVIYLSTYNDPLYGVNVKNNLFDGFYYHALYVNSFENYQNFNGLLIAQEHKKSEGDWNLLLRNIKVELED